MIYVTKEDGKTILWGKYGDDKDDAYDLVTDKNDVVIFRQLDTGKEFVYNDGDWYESATSGGGGGGGTGGGVLIVHESDDVLDKTWKEIHDAALTSVVILIRSDEFETIIKYCSDLGINDPDYYVAFDGSRYYVASSENGYPVLDMG